MDVEDRPAKDHRREEMQISESPAQHSVNGLLYRLGPGEHPLADGIAVAVADVCKPGGAQRAAGGLVVAEDAPLAGSSGVVFRGSDRLDGHDACYGDDQERQDTLHPLCDTPFCPRGDALRW